MPLDQIRRKRALRIWYRRYYTRTSNQHRLWAGQISKTERVHSVCQSWTQAGDSGLPISRSQFIGSAIYDVRHIRGCAVLRVLSTAFMIDSCRPVCVCVCVCACQVDIMRSSAPLNDAWSTSSRFSFRFVSAEINTDFQCCTKYNQLAYFSKSLSFGEFYYRRKSKSVPENMYSNKVCT